MNHQQFSQEYIRLRAQVKKAPLEPGVYIIRDGEGRVIYIGKARLLRNRLGSYFSGDKDIKTRTLLRHAKNIETITVSNEFEALLLENTLIKQHSPKYNINLKDGKTYPVVRITAEPFPRIFRTRHIVRDGSLYFGPFPNVQAVDTVLELIDRLFPLRKCRTLRKRTAPCLYYHIGCCSAPCCGKITKEEYAGHVERVKKLLSGETEALTVDLTERMREAAAGLQYERAAQVRDAIRAIGNLSADNAVVDFNPEDRDYLAWASEGVLVTYTVFSMRGGRMTGRELFHTRSAAEDEESLQLFLANYYGPDKPPPPRIYLGSGLERGEDLLRLFQDRFGQSPEFLVCDEKRHEAVLTMAYQNAKEDLARRLKERGAGPALDELARVLGLKNRPDRIEGFDIAQLDGSHPVASLISFVNGVPDKKNYRYFKLKTVVGVVDDFASIREAVSRRYTRMEAEGKELPDLILIDGGIGQVNAAQGVMDALGLDCEIAGLAKRAEEIWRPGAAKPLSLDRRSEALKVLQFVRDETHRFATSFNQKLRSKDLILPSLQSVEGIGPARAAALIKAFGSLEGIAAAEVADLAGRCGLGVTTASAVKAAAKKTLEDRAVESARLSGGGGRRGAARAAGREYRIEENTALGAALAAEAMEEWDAPEPKSEDESARPG